MVGIGGLFVMGGGYFPTTIPEALGAVSVLLAFVNVSGGFVITKRMLDMFKRKLSLHQTYTRSNWHRPY
jgi:NAD(P) transhydrogenase